MFKELHPLIQNRALTITVAAIGGGKIRVNVVPQALEQDAKVNDQIGHSAKDKVATVPESAIAALTTPLSLTGSPEEIDAELTQSLSVFAESHVHLQQTLEAAKAQIASAIKAIQERDKSKSKTSAPSASRPAEKQEKQAPAGELLPLWCKPPDGSATAAGATSAGPEAATSGYIYREKSPDSSTAAETP